MVSVGAVLRVSRRSFLAPLSCACPCTLSQGDQWSPGAAGSQRERREAPTAARLGRRRASSLVALAILVSLLLLPCTFASEAPVGDGALARKGAGASSLQRRLSTNYASNLAMFQSVMLSSTAALPNKATGSPVYGEGFKISDGDTGTDFFEGAGCAETANSADPWARIDFGREVPMAVVKLLTRTDSSRPSLGPIELYVGNNGQAWRENTMCAENVMMRRGGPQTAECLFSGRYLFIVLRVAGMRSSPLSLCEVEVQPQGPSGTKHILQTTGSQWTLSLEGIALSKADRIRIVPHEVLCGDWMAATMSPAVLELTSPLGERAAGSDKAEQWHFVHIDTVGLYKVCWCGGVGDCSVDEDFAYHVATLVINGVMLTIGGNGVELDRDLPVLTGQLGTDTPLTNPYGVASTATRVYFTEMDGNRIRYIDMDDGRLHTLSGFFGAGVGTDPSMADTTKWLRPMGIGLSSNSRILYVADSGSHRIRSIALASGQVQTVAGNGYRGFTGDGKDAVDAQLNYPTCVQADRNDIIYICDTGNYRIRMVSLTLEMLVPGTAEYKAGIILTSAGNGLNGLLGERGNGGLSQYSQIGSPSAIAISQEFLSADVGAKPSFLYVAEQETHSVRSIALQYLSYSGIISPSLGSYRVGNDLEEGMPLKAVEAKLDQPQGLAADGGHTWVSDTANNRILMMPRMEYISLGCWRENTEAPWIGTIEPASFTNLPPSRDLEMAQVYLDGVPELRNDPIQKCALAALQLGYPMFALRQMGHCTTGPIAHLQYQEEGTSTSCADGLGGSRDNSVYRFARTGFMVEQLGTVYKMAGREGVQGFADDKGSAWTSELNHPTGIAVNPVTKDIMIADTGNNRMRMIFSKTGPDRGHVAICTNGAVCAVTIAGNGLCPGNQLGIFPLESKCGEDGATFQTGFEFNPVHDEASPSFQKKTFIFGKPYAPEAGTFRLCFCALGSVVFGRVVACGPKEATAFIMDAGTVAVSGPDAGTSMTARAGQQFDLAIYGLYLSMLDRIRVVDRTQLCGENGAQVSVPQAGPPDLLEYKRTAGNGTWSLWQGVKVIDKGLYTVCWCQGALDSVNVAPCVAGGEYSFSAAALEVFGPEYYDYLMPMAVDGWELVVLGKGLGANDRIRVVDAVDTKCGSNKAATMSVALSPDGQMPYGAADRVSNYETVWTNIVLRRSGDLLVCWCGKLDGCYEGADFSIPAVKIRPQGPITAPYAKVKADIGETFIVKIMGAGFTGYERLNIVDRYTECGSEFASQKNPFNIFGIAGPPTGRTNEFIFWDTVAIKSSSIYKACYCDCRSLDELCCSPNRGNEYYIDVMGIYINQTKEEVSSYEGQNLPPISDSALADVELEETTVDAVIGEFETATCPGLAIVIESEITCRAAAKLWGLTWQGTCVANTDVYYPYTDLLRCRHTEIAPTNRHACWSPPPSITTTVGPGKYKPLPPTQAPVCVLPDWPHAHWNDALPKDIPKKVSMTVKTRGTPAHASCKGPVIVFLTTADGGQIAEGGIFKNLMVGEKQHVSWEISLDSPAHIVGVAIEVQSIDAWLCEYIDVDVEGFEKKRFTCDGWGSNYMDRLGRNVTLTHSEYVPKPRTSMWETAYLTGDYCGGCAIGFECVHETMPLRTRIARQSEILYEYIPAYHATCRPACGDGLVVAGEECDDGNMRSLDGCSGTCQIEHGFECASYDHKPSRCLPRMCDQRDSNGVIHDTDDLFMMGGSHGYMCSANFSVYHQPPVDKAWMCYPWSPSTCPTGKDPISLNGFIYSANNTNQSFGRVDCSATRMSYLGGGLDCNQRMYKSGPAGTDGYASYEECSSQCAMDSTCGAAQFFINRIEGGDTCPEGVLPKDCGSRCYILSQCPNPNSTNFTNLGNLPSDMYHVGRKEVRAVQEIGGDYFCSQLHIPLPVWAYEAAGLITIQMDSPTAPPLGVAAGASFDCARLLMPSSYLAVGGNASSCTWVLPDTLELALGTLATLGRPEQVDLRGQIFGTPSLVVLDSRKLRPAGVTADYWQHDDFKEIDIFVRRDQPYNLFDNGAPTLPTAIIRAPQVLGGCSPLELSADTSTMGEGRRWKKVTWTCIDTTPDATLAAKGHMEFYSACERIQPMLNAKPWCGPTISSIDYLAMDLGIARPCELRVVLKPEDWCGLGTLQLQVEIETSQGLKRRANFTSRIEYGTRLPKVQAVGSTNLTISPQRNPGDPLPRLRLEVTTEADIMSVGNCGCNLSAPPKDDGSETNVNVKWFYGEVINGIPPRPWELTPITDEDEAYLMNVLIMPFSGELLLPGTIWHFVARASYGVYDEEQTITATFNVTVGPVEPPIAHLEAPTTICPVQCDFILDASGSHIRELIAWEANYGRRLQEGGAGQGNLSQVTTQTTTSMQSLMYEWTCIQLNGKEDDQPKFDLKYDMRALLIQFCSQNTKDYLYITSESLGGDLPAGLYLFEVKVTDRAFPGLHAAASAVIRAKAFPEACEPSFAIEAPGNGDVVVGDANVRFKQMAYGLNCPYPSAVQGAANLLLYRAAAGQPRHQMQAVEEIELDKFKMWTNGVPDLEKGHVMMGVAQPGRHLMPGFVYAFRIMLALDKNGIKTLRKYREQLIAAGPSKVDARSLDNYKNSIGGLNESSEFAERVTARDPVFVPEGVFDYYTDVFTVHRPPCAGSLTMLSPSGGKGFAMKDVFKFQQLWATNSPDLEYSFYYSTVKKERRVEFDAAVALGFSDSGAEKRLTALVPDGLVLFSAWARDPTLSAPLPVGMYVLEGRVRDAHGAVASKFLAMESLKYFQGNITTTAQMIAELESYVFSARNAILQVRAANRPAAAVAPVAGAVSDMPDLSEYDFESMMTWRASSGQPSPLLTQSFFGTPVISTRIRQKVIDFLNEILNIFEDTVTTIDDEAIVRISNKQAGRRLGETRSHVEMLSESFVFLARNAKAVRDDNICVRIATLCKRLLLRVRYARGDLGSNPIATDHFVQTAAVLLSASRPIPLPRRGVIEVNVSALAQTMLANEVLRVMEELGEAIAAFAEFDRIIEISAELPSGTHGAEPGDRLRMTVVVNRIDTVIQDGVNLEPDLQSTERWPYPMVHIDGLGPPGFEARKWAGNDREISYGDAYCFGEVESFLDRVVVVLISWPISPVQYSSGSLVDVAANVTMPYSLSLRSCGKGIIIKDLLGKAQFVFRLDDKTVRDREYGYKDMIPYRVTWWEDVSGVLGSVDRIRRWTTQGCLTDWERSEKDIVRAQCDRLPAPSSGGIFAIELVQRPPYLVLDEPPASRGMHNVGTYMMLFLFARLVVLWIWAKTADTIFWPSEHDLSKIHFVPAEHKWKQASRMKDRELPAKGLCGSVQKALLKWMRAAVKSAYTVFGQEFGMSLELRELQTMRSGNRNSVYEHFFDSIAGQATRPEKRIQEIKAAAKQMQNEQRRMLEDTRRPQPERNAVWPEATAIADSSEGWHQHEAIGERPKVQDRLLAAMEAQRHEAEHVADCESRTVSSGSDPRTAPGRPGGSSESGFAQIGLAVAVIAERTCEVVALPKLPRGWEAVHTEGESLPYYHNTATGQTTWEQPRLQADGTVLLGTELARGRPRPRLDLRTGKVLKLGSLGKSANPLNAKELEYEDTRRNVFSGVSQDAEARRNEPRMKSSDGFHGAAPGEAVSTSALPNGASTSGAASSTEAWRPSRPPVVAWGSDTCAPAHVHGGRRELRTEAAHAASSMGSSYIDVDDEEDSDNAVVRGQVNMAFEAAANSMEVAMPYGWEVERNDDGREFYVNARSGITQWTPPRLPAHWEERISSDGRVYYLNLWDKSTTWHWPEEKSKEMVYPHGTEMMLQDDDTESDTTADTSLADEADAYGADDFLRLDPEMIGLPEDMGDALGDIMIEEERDESGKALLNQSVLGGTRKAKKKRKKHNAKEERDWGQSEQEEKWMNLKAQLRDAKIAHEARFETAKLYPGVREFIRPHEMQDLINNWDAQLEEAHMKMDMQRRKHMPLGHRCELRRQEMRSIFPVVQRLIWTKWVLWQIYANSLERAMPTWYIFLNTARPSKANRCLLYFVCFAVMLLASTMVLATEAPVNEELEAGTVPIWDLFLEILTIPWEPLPFVVSFVAVLCGHLVQSLCKKCFFFYEVAMHRLVTTKAGQQETMIYWHELAQMGKWVCIMIVCLCCVGTVVLCALVPQPRAAVAMRTFFLALLWCDLVIPMLVAAVVTMVLSTARRSKLFDGLLTAFPSLMDFQSVGVTNPDFLRWRVERFVTELEQMRLIYGAEDPEEDVFHRRSGRGELQGVALALEN